MIPAVVCVYLLSRLTPLSGMADAVEAGVQAPSVGVELTSLELTALSDNRSEARAVLKVSNPLPSSLRVAESRFVLSIRGREVGQGSTRPRRLPAHKTRGVEVLLQIDREAFLSALGGSFDAGMRVDAELSGAFGLRLSSGDLSLPLRLPGRMGTDGARSGVYALPEGGASLSPH